MIALLVAIAALALLSVRWRARRCAPPPMPELRGRGSGAFLIGLYERRVDRKRRRVCA